MLNGACTASVPSPWWNSTIGWRPTAGCGQRDQIDLKITSTAAGRHEQRHPDGGRSLVPGGFRRASDLADGASESGSAARLISVGV